MRRWMSGRCVIDEFSAELERTGAALPRIRDYITHWDTGAKPFTWTSTADEILFYSGQVWQVWGRL